MSGMKTQPHYSTLLAFSSATRIWKARIIEFRVYKQTIHTRNSTSFTLRSLLKMSYIFGASRVHPHSRLFNKDHYEHDCTNICVWVPSSVLLSMCREVKLVNHVILCLVFWGTTVLISTLTVPCYVATCSAPGFQFLHIFISTHYFLFVCLFWKKTF